MNVLQLHIQFLIVGLVSWLQSSLVDTLLSFLHIWVLNTDQVVHLCCRCIDTLEDMVVCHTFGNSLLGTHPDTNPCQWFHPPLGSRIGSSKRKDHPVEIVHSHSSFSPHKSMVAYNLAHEIDSIPFSIGQE